MVSGEYEQAGLRADHADAATPLDTVTRGALEVISRQMARPFVGLTSTGELLGETRLLRVV